MARGCRKVINPPLLIMTLREYRIAKRDDAKRIAELQKEMIRKGLPGCRNNAKTLSMQNTSYTMRALSYGAFFQHML